MILNDRRIIELCNDPENPLISPMVPALVRHVDSIGHSVIFCAKPTDRKVISYGLSSYGYDLTLGDEFKIFRHIPGTVVNPKDFNPENVIDAPLHEDKWGRFFILPAHSYGLGVSVERLCIPKNITALFIGKSTYARSGIIVNLTPGESGWKGHLTIEISNSSSADCRIYAGEGICQALFFEGLPCETSYGDRQGKYQDQPAAVILPRV